MKKKIVIAVVIAAVVGVGLYFGLRDKNGVSSYVTNPIEKGDITEYITASGTVNPVITVTVGTQVSGRIKAIYADFNSVVKKGDLLAEIDPSMLQSQLEQSQANLLSAQATLQKAQANYSNSRKNYERAQTLFGRNFIARSDLDSAEAAYKSDHASVAVAKASVAQAKAALENAQTNLGYTKIISPIDGVVISRAVDIGQTVAASFSTPTLFTVAQDMTKMQISTAVSEADIGQLANGQDVEFSVDAYPGTKFKGKVDQVRNAPTTTENVVTYAVMVTVDNKDLKLKPGMTANVSILVAHKEGILKVTNDALRFTPTVKGSTEKVRYENKGIWILKDGKPVRVDIKVGISDGNNTEVASDKLKEGELVIIEDSQTGSDSASNSKKKDHGPPGPF
jgi:HlyD family secretion protein